MEISVGQVENLSLVLGLEGCAGGVIGMRDEERQCKLIEHAENSSKMDHHIKSALFVMLVSTHDSRGEE